MLMINHLEFEVAAKIFKGFNIFNTWEKFSVDKELGLKFQRAGGSVLIPERCNYRK